MTVPLSSQVALIGRFEDVPETLALSRQGVAAVNNKTLAYSSRFIAACDDDFLIDTLDRGIVGSKEVIEQIEKWAAGARKEEIAVHHRRPLGKDGLPEAHMIIERARRPSRKRKKAESKTHVAKTVPRRRRH